MMAIPANKKKTLKISITLNDIIVKWYKADVVRREGEINPQNLGPAGIELNTNPNDSLLPHPPAPPSCPTLLPHPPAPPYCPIMFRHKWLCRHRETYSWQLVTLRVDGMFSREAPEVVTYVFCLKHWPTAVVQLPATIFPPKGHYKESILLVYITLQL